MTDILGSSVNEDHIPLFVSGATEDYSDSPGYIFGLGSTPSHGAQTILRWIAANDPDFPLDRPAKIGGTDWNSTYSRNLFDAAQQYAETHPEEYEWVGGYLTDMTFKWGEEPGVRLLKDCDYVFPPSVIQPFAREYRNLGYSAEFIGIGTHFPYMSLARHIQLDEFEYIEKMVFCRSYRWWNEEGRIISLAKELLPEDCSDCYRNYRDSRPYLDVLNDLTVMFDLVQYTIDGYGWENFGSQAIYNAAQTFTTDIDGSSHSYSETKRISSNNTGIYEVSSSADDLVRVTDDWITIVTEP